MRPFPRRAALAGVALAALAVAVAARPPDDRPPASTAPAPAASPRPGPHRSPIALALSADGSRLLTANQTAGTVSLVDAASGSVLDEVEVGEKPSGVALSRDGRRGVVANWYGYDVAILDVAGDTLRVVGRVAVGPEPRGVALSADGDTAYVAVGAADAAVRVDLKSQAVTGRLAVGREPRGVAITPDGSRLVVGNARGGTLSVIATGPWEVERTIPVDGTNLRQVAVGPDGKDGYAAGMKNRRFATTRSNIDQGWVLGQRLTRAALDGSTPFETLTPDVRGEAAGDAHGVAVSPDGAWLALACGGTHEVILFRTGPKPLPWRSNNSRDLIHAELLKGDGRFRRVPLGGRPTEVAFAPDGKSVFVANYLGDSVQVVDAESGSLTRTVALGGPAELSAARKGEALFHDATRSFNQWYSCNTCHSDGHTNGQDFDTLNDGSQDLSTAHLKSRKKVPTLRGVLATGPWTWHGWQTGLDDAMVESFTKSMQGKAPSPGEVRDLVTFLGTLDFPRNPNREADGSPSPEARRGEAVFRSAKAACNSCHGGPEFTDGKVHSVGLEERGDAYVGYNPPSLKGSYDKDPYLHDGRSATLRDALAGPHAPDAVTGLGELTEAELSDLIAYVRSL